MKMPRLSRVLACLAAAISLFTTTTALADAKTETAIAQFKAVIVPTVLATASYIEKPADERGLAFDGLGAKKKACYDDSWDAHTADEHLAFGAAYECYALIGWMGNDDASACKQLQSADELYANNRDGSPEIAQIFVSAQFADIHARLLKAADCKQKTTGYWAERALAAYYALSTTFQKDAAGVVTIDQASFSRIYDACDSATDLSKGVSIVARAAFKGCRFYSRISKGDSAAACEDLKEGLEKLALVTASDPLAAHAEKLRGSLTQFSDLMKCQTTVTPPPAAAPPPAPVQNVRPAAMQQVYDLKAEAVGYENQATEYRGYARGMASNAYTKSACEAYIKAASFMNKASSAYYRAITLIYKAHLDDNYPEFAYLKAAFYDRVKALEEALSDLKEEAAEVCKASGMKIY